MSGIVLWLAAAAATFVAGVSASYAATVAGPAVVVDGDTLRIGEERIRLLGIDAPELDQACAAAAGGTWPCGAEAAGVLAFYVEGGPVICVGEERDQYGRLLAICRNETFQDFNRNMVLSGLAWSYLSAIYVPDEAEARAAGLGVWQAPTQTAAEYRRAQDAAILANQPLPRDPACAIKGNINAAGDRIYHLPGAAGYEETVIRVEQGERWFCSVEEAVAAGWRSRR